LKEKNISIKKKPRHVGLEAQTSALGLVIFFLFKGEDNRFKTTII
jgi:hypothetical protein